MNQGIAALVITLILGYHPNDYAKYVFLIFFQYNGYNKAFNRHTDTASIKALPSVKTYSGYSGNGATSYSGHSGNGASTYSGYSGNGASTYSGYSGNGASTYSGYSGNGASTYSGYSGNGATKTKVYDNNGDDEPDIKEPEAAGGK